MIYPFDCISDFIFVETPLEPADVILIPGGSHPQVMERAAALYHQGLAPYILPSGGSNPRLHDFASEWDFLRGVGEQAGVPPEAILKEDLAQNTLENTMRVLYHLALADFYERTRRHRFLLTLAAVIYLGVLVNDGKLFLALSPGDLNPLSPGYRGEFNSAWIGTMTVLVTNTFLGLFGFYLVNDCIQRDIRTGVGQIIATTPVSRATYLVGKWISNCVVLFVLELILAAAAAVMVLLKHEAALDLGALLMPFLAVALPYMALIAALAVVFETVPWLRGAVGNALFFFLWIFSLSSLMFLMLGGMELPFLKDPLGLNVFSASLHAAASAAFPNDTIGVMGVVNFTYQLKVFNWSGLEWTLGIVGKQWLWAVFGLGLILLSTLWFGRFDPSREGLRRTQGKPQDAKEDKPVEPRKKAFRSVLPNLSPLVSKLAQVNPFLGVLLAELRMLLNGRRWWWWLGS